MSSQHLSVQSTNKNTPGTSEDSHPRIGACSLGGSNGRNRGGSNVLPPHTPHYHEDWKLMPYYPGHPDCLLRIQIPLAARVCGARPFRERQLREVIAAFECSKYKQEYTQKASLN